MILTLHCPGILMSLLTFRSELSLFISLSISGFISTLGKMWCRECPVFSTQPLFPGSWSGTATYAPGLCCSLQPCWVFSALPFVSVPHSPPAETIKEQSCAGPLCQKCTPYRIVCLGWCWLNSCLWRLYFQLLSTLESSWLFSHFHWGIAGHFYHQLLPSFIHYLPYPCNHPFGHSIRHYPAYLSQPYTLSSEIHWKW